MTSNAPQAPAHDDANLSEPEGEWAALLDDPEEWGAFGRPMPREANGPDAPAVWESHMVLEGMHCAACALTIEDVLRTVPGVVRADVSAATHRARVVWDSALVRPSQWMARIRKAGYLATPAMDALVRERRQAENRKALWRWLVAGFCMMQVMMYAWPAYVAAPGDLSMEMETLLRWASWVICLPVVLFACGPFFSSALHDIRQRRISMDLPVALGMLITFVVSTMGTFDPAGIFGREVFFDSLTMFVFFLLSGRWLELRLRDRTAGALEAVMNRLPESVERRALGGSFERVAVRRLVAGDLIRIVPGQVFPADGSLVQGHTLVDEALLTGESTPIARGMGERVIAGSFNLQSVVEMSVEGLGEDTRFAQIVTLMESAALQKPRLAQLADRVARPFLIVVLVAAALAAAWWWSEDPGHALMVAVAVLIVTCPCALSLATPVAMLTAAGTLARHGVLVRNLSGLEALAAVDTVVFDKTGTLTQDGLTVGVIHPAEHVDQRQALAMAAALARHSLHPASRALVSASAGQVILEGADLVETAGGGVAGTVVDAEGHSRQLRLGSSVFALGRQGSAPGMQVVLAEQLAGAWHALARFDLQEDVRPDAAEAVRQLRGAGIEVMLLSGDRSASVQRVAVDVGIEQAQGDCAPQDKLTSLRAAQGQGRHVAMVGDGLNDGPVLAGAHVSFAFGKSVPLAQSRSDLVVLGNQLTLVPQTLLLARQTLRIVRQNLIWAAAYNALSIPLAVVGWMPAWLAGLGMALSSLLVVLNAARLSRALPVAVHDAAANASEPPIRSTLEMA